MNKNFLPLTAIYIPPGEDSRIREPDNLKRAVKERMTSFLRFGQMQPILIEKMEEEVDGKEWKLVDGQVRYVSMGTLSILHDMEGREDIQEAFEKWGMRKGEIEVTTKDTLDPITGLMMEFHANADRDNFTWEEKGRYIRRIHDMLQTEHGRKEWKAKHTAEYIGQSEAVVSQFLQLTDESEPATKSERVKKATTKGAALKQLKIEKDRRVRKERVTKVKATSDVVEIAEAASLSVFKGDCREWIKRIPDNSLSWFHWDPPYGGKEGEGGAFAAHGAIQTEHDYATRLMLDMFPEIWRVLHDGGWIALWYTPVHYSWIRLHLQGHRFSDGSVCEYCERHILKDHGWLSSNYSCVPSPFRFWVNPYPNQWFKADRVADGHEITRFLTKQTEPFLLAGKQKKDTPILVRSDVGNVFTYNSVPQEARRHVNHKPWALLAEILSLISVPGGLGGDAGAGSGSIIEAAYNTNRKVIVAEMNEDHHVDSLSVAVDRLTHANMGADSIAPWLRAKFTT